jgi:hypothetical protein
MIQFELLTTRTRKTNYHADDVPELTKCVRAVFSCLMYKTCPAFKIQSLSSLSNYLLRYRGTNFNGASGRQDPSDKTV